jgi:cytochrome P450
MSTVDEDITTDTTTAPSVVVCDIDSCSSSSTSPDPERIVDPGGGPRLDDLADLADLDWATFDPGAPGYFDDPTVQLGALREQAAVHHMASTDTYLLTRHEHVHALARDRRLGVETARASTDPTIDPERRNAGRADAERSIMHRDGPDHTRVRRVMQRAFTPKSIAQLQHRTVLIADRLLDDLARNGGGDLIGGYARRLPVAVIADLLGFPTADLDRLCAWSHAVTRTLDPMSTPAERARADVAAQQLDEYVEAAYEAQRVRPNAGLLSHMIAAEDDADRMTRDEIVANTVLLVVAGHETTTNLIGNGAVALLRHPGQRSRLVDDPSLDGNAVEEVLRFDSPVQMTRRISNHDIEVAGVAIPTGSVVTLCSSSANRDPRKWGPTANEFRIDRSDAADQVSFGGGPHFCLGAALARMQGRVALPRMFRRFPTMQPIEEPRFEQRIVLRGVGRLLVGL